MSSANEYCCSITPEPYEPAPTPFKLTFEEYKVLVSAHEEWKVAKGKEAHEEKLRMDQEAQKAKVEALRQAAEKKKEDEWLAEEKWLADEKELQYLAEVKQQKEAVEKKKHNDLKKKKEKKKLRKDKERGTDGDTEREKSEASKEKALKRLKEKQDSKWKATVPAGPKRKHATKSSSMVADSDKEGMPGPSKKMRTEISGPAEGEEEFGGNKHCMWCRLDGVQCFACPASKKSAWGHTCSHYRTKKAMCSFNKGMSSTMAVCSEEVLEVLEKLTCTVETLTNKVDVLTGQVVNLWSHVDDLVNDFQSKEINSLEELISNMEEWQASCMELKDLEGVNSETL
ncbi:hypothetical protein ARMSODRAFT_973361 [Armillaria solidipes]|uniref:Uncharacterized protein n=1 Tax=Armillaria solidipes TaxID=1076256 RepID=A0A2H3C4P7_9AGAR|nr:hypothetical protein ARMSODRAFT_973361 [Armillaria solidipes]